MGFHGLTGAKAVAAVGLGLGFRGRLFGRGAIGGGLGTAVVGLAHRFLLVSLIRIAGFCQAA